MKLLSQIAAPSQSGLQLKAAEVCPGSADLDPERASVVLLTDT